MDPDLALLSLFLPRDRRPACWALFLLQGEIARVRESVSDTHLGLIRLQWWRDNLVTPPAQHPFLPTLADAIRRYDLPITDFETLLYAREFDLSDTLPAHLEGLVHYADYTTTPLLRLAQRIGGEVGDDQILQPLGIAAGLTRCMQHVVSQARAGICLLPHDMMDAAHISKQAVCSGNALPLLSPILQAIGEEAQRQLDLANGQGVKLSRFLQATHRLYTLRLRQMAAAGYEPTQARYNVPPPWLALRVTLGLV